MRVVPNTEAAASFFHVAGSDNSDTVRNATVTSSTEYVVLDWIRWSYDGTPTGGYVRVSTLTPTSTLLEFAVTKAGPGKIEFPGGLRNTKGKSMQVRIGAGGAGVVAKVSIRQR